MLNLSRTRQSKETSQINLLLIIFFKQLYETLLNIKQRNFIEVHMITVVLVLQDILKCQCVILE